MKKVPMKYCELDKHADKCIKKETTCPLDCGKNIISINDHDGQVHLDVCLNALIECDICKFNLKRKDRIKHAQGHV